jgi:hypothetical protein
VHDVWEAIQQQQQQQKSSSHARAAHSSDSAAAHSRSTTSGSALQALGEKEEEVQVLLEKVSGLQETLAGDGKA